MQTVHEPARETSIRYSADVIVVGAGLAGCFKFLFCDDGQHSGHVSHRVGARARSSGGYRTKGLVLACYDGLTSTGLFENNLKGGR